MTEIDSCELCRRIYYYYFINFIRDREMRATDRPRAETDGTLPRSV